MRKKLIAFTLAAALGVAMPASFSAARASEELADAGSDVITEERILSAMDGVYEKFSAGYEEKYKSGDYSAEWRDGVYRLGMLAYGEAAKDSEIKAAVRSSAEDRRYLLNGGTLGGYIEALGYSPVIAELYRGEGGEEKLSNVRAQLQYNYARGFLDYSRAERGVMIADACLLLSETDGDPKFEQMDHTAYMNWRERLFDFDDGFWYRDTRYVFDGRNPIAETNDLRPVYFSHSNALVYVSLARRLSVLDEEHPHYATYLYDFRLMSYALKQVQREDGFWDANLSDSALERGRESTGTAGFLYGI